MALAVTGVTRLGAGDGELLVDAFVGFFEGDLHRRAEVSSLSRPVAAPAAAATTAAEELLKDVLEAATAATAKATHPAHAAGTAGAAAVGAAALFGLLEALVAH